MKIAIIYNTDYYLYLFKQNFIKKLKDRGDEVYIICPGGKYADIVAHTLGVVHLPVVIDRKGLNPFNDAIFLWQLIRIFNKYKIELMHTFTIKPNIYGAIAGFVCGVPLRISQLEGLGSLFGDGNRGAKHRLVNFIVKILYRIALMLADRVIFLNNDDRNYFIEKKLVHPAKAELILSIGVDTNEYSPATVSDDQKDALRKKLNIGRNNMVITMIARLLWEKGVKEFIDAAYIIRKKHAHAMFILVGGMDTASPSSVSIKYIRDAEAKGTIVWLGERSDIKQILSITDIFTLPSYYREGVPRVNLEAMAMGKPVITTDNVGCKETVEHGKNGYLVPPKDAPALARSLELLIENKERRRQFGDFSRIKAIKEFDESIVINKTLQLYAQVMKNK